MTEADCRADALTVPGASATTGTAIADFWIDPRLMASNMNSWAPSGCYARFSTDTVYYKTVDTSALHSCTTERRCICKPRSTRRLDVANPASLPPPPSPPPSPTGVSFTSCTGGSRIESVDLEKGVTYSIATLPKGTYGISMEISADADLDMKVECPTGLSATDAASCTRCLIGYRCKLSRDDSDTIYGMALTFSGNDSSADPLVKESMTIDIAKYDIPLAVNAFRKTAGTVTYSYTGICGTTACPTACV